MSLETARGLAADSKSPALSPWDRRRGARPDGAWIGAGLPDTVRPERASAELRTYTLTSPHARLRKLRPHSVQVKLGSMSASRTSWPAVRVGVDVVAAPMIATIDQDVASPGGAFVRTC